MKDPVDKTLADHIRQTLDDYQTPYMLGAWEQFDQQRRASKQRLMGWYRYAVAACLLGGMLVVPLWLADGPLPTVSSSDLVDAHRSANPMMNEEATARSQSTRVDAPISTKEPKTTLLMPERTKRTQLAEWSSSRVRLPDSDGNIGRLSAPLHTSPEPNPPPNPPITDLPNPNHIDINRLPIRSVEPITGLSLLTPVWPPVTPATPTPVTQIEQATASTLPIDRTRRRQVTWSVALAPQSTYAQNSSPSVGIGGGVFSEIALNRRMSVATGLSLASQALNVRAPADMPIPLSGKQLATTGVQLLAFDVPVNLKYRFGKLNKPLFHLSAGLSSLAFLRENYAETYQIQQMVPVIVSGSDGQPRPGWRNETINETEFRSADAFSSIYWGRLLNIAVGVERPLSQRLLFSVEPYLKYPLGSLTQQNLRLGSAGVSLRVVIR
ncbi:PorT family protein [Fibrisoma montanum]|uniref:PorT family protein n=1 Tax=Fibrisoma montanum TaxID=2305895 RepID=A0A418M2V9_9BACT|nr:outer membrane beta-barrel protein [Fibrisoma montanum]RIV19985.1 PorT family protein [Fibrisoma montanum]